MDNWYKLDNAAKLFPSVTNTKNSSVYRVSAVLKEKVDRAFLQKAVEHIYNRFPAMFVRLRKGVFWNYFDSNVNKFIIEEETDYPCSNINPKHNNGYMVKVLYYNRKISVEVFHSLTDGSGALEFLKTLVYYYLVFSGHNIDDEGIVVTTDSPVSAADLEDGFLHYYNPSDVKPEPQRKAYRIRGVTFQCYGVNVVSGSMQASAVNRVAKAYGTTITGYVSAALIYSIYQARQKFENNKLPIIVTVPVNLRRAFPSKTLRNFFTTVNVGAAVSQLTTFQEIVDMVTDDLKRQTSKEYLEGLIANNIKIEKNIAAKVAPLFIKDIFVPLGFNIWGETKKSITVSNLGNVILPVSMAPYIEKIDVVLYPTPKSPLNCGLCSVNDNLIINFSRTIEEADIIRYFFSFLAENDKLEITVRSNNWGVEE